MDKGLEELEKLIRATNLALAEMKYSLLFNDWSEKFESKPENNLFLQSYSRGLHFTSRYKAVNKRRAILENLHGRCGKEPAADTSKSKEMLTGLMEEDMAKCLPAVSKISAVERSTVVESLCNTSPVQEKDMRKEENSVRKVKPAHEISGKADEDIKIEVEEASELTNGIFKTATITSCQISDSENMTTNTENKRQNKTFHLKKMHSGSGTTSSRTRETPGESSGRATSESRKTCDGGGDSDNHAEGEKKTKASNEGKEEKNGVVRFASEHRQRRRFPRLELQLLPSLHISAELQVQKIHCLEIMPATDCATPNTATDLLSHEQVEKDKKKKIFEDGVSCLGTSECFYCGKSMEVQKKRVRSEEIDKILAKCHYNIFHPQIDSFVRRCGRKETKSCVADEEKSKDGFSKVTVGAESGPTWTHNVNNEEREEEPQSTATKFNLNELSLKVSKKFQTKSLKLDERRLRLENIFRKLYNKINESNEYLTYCTLKSFAETRKQYIKGGEIPKIVSPCASEKLEPVSTIGNRRSSARSHVPDSMVEGEGKFMHLYYRGSVKNDIKREKYKHNIRASTVNVKKVNNNGESRKNRKRWFVKDGKEPVVNVGSVETSSDSKTSYGCDDDFENDSSSFGEKTWRIAEGKSGRTGTFDVVLDFPEKMCKIGTRSSDREGKRIWTASNECDLKSGRILMERFVAGRAVETLPIETAEPTDAAPARQISSVRFSSSTSDAEPSSKMGHLLAECRPNGILARTDFSSRSTLGELRPENTSTVFDGCSFPFSSKEATTSFGDILSALSERFAKARSLVDRLSENDREYPGNESQSREADRRRYSRVAGPLNEKIHNLGGARAETGGILQTSITECLADAKKKSGDFGRSSATKPAIVGAEAADSEVRPFATDRCLAPNKTTPFPKKKRREPEADNWLCLKDFKKADLSLSEGEIGVSDVSDAVNIRSFRSLGEIPTENISANSASA